MEAERGVDVLAGDRVGVLRRDLLDVDAAAGRHHGDRPALAAVHRDADVELVDEVDGALDEHPVDGVALQVHPEDAPRGLAELALVVGELDAAGLPAAADLHLRLHGDGVADRGAGLDGLVDRRRQLGRRRGDARVREDALGLVLVELHGRSGRAFPRAGVSVSETGRPRGAESNALIPALVGFRA